MTVLRGELEVCIDGASHLLRDSDVILIGSNKGHATLARQPESVAMVLHIAPDLFREYYGDMNALQFTCCSEGGRKNERPFVLLRAHLASLMLSAQVLGAEEKLRFESARYARLHTLSLYFPPERLSTGKAMLLRNTFDAVEKIVQYIDANYMQKITLNDLAQVSKYNRNYISQFFKSNLGVNFHDYLTRIRLREATLALGQTDQSVGIAAGQTEHHAQRAAEEGLRADHDERAEDKAARGRGAGLCAELLRADGHDERAEHEADDLRADILHLSGAVEAERACDIAQEARDAEAHVGRVSEMRQQDSGQTDDRAGHNDPPTDLFLHCGTPLVIFLEE